MSRYYVTFGQEACACNKKECKYVLYFDLLSCLSFMSGSTVCIDTEKNSPSHKLLTTRPVCYLDYQGHDLWKETWLLSFFKCILVAL